MRERRAVAIQRQQGAANEMEGQPGRMEGIGGGDQRLRNQFAVVVRQRTRPGGGSLGGGQRHPVEGHQHLAACHVMAFEQAGGSGQRQVQAPCTGVCVHGAGQDIVGLRQPAHHPQHQRDNLAAAELVLSADELQQIDARFPPPRAKSALAMR